MPSAPSGQSELQELRAKVRAKRHSAPLFDTRRWVRDVERLYEAMAGALLSGHMYPSGLINSQTPPLEPMLDSNRVFLHLPDALCKALGNNGASEAK